MHNSSSDFVFQGQTASILSYSISQFPDKKEVSAQMACFYAQASRYFVDLLKNDFDSLGRLPKWWRCIFTRDNEKHRTSFLKSGAFGMEEKREESYSSARCMPRIQPSVCAMPTLTPAMGGAVLHAKAAAAAVASRIQTGDHVQMLVIDILIIVGPQATGGAQELVTCIEILLGKSDSSYAMLTDSSCLKNAICSSSRS